MTNAKRKMVEAEKAKKLAEQEFRARVSSMVLRIRSTKDLTSALRYVYDNSQGNADCDAPEESETYQNAQHDYAIERVWEKLNALNLLTEGDDERVVDFAYSEVS